MNAVHKQAGFTLLELIITIVMLAVISVAVGRIVLEGLSMMQTSDKISSTGWQGLIALERFTNDVHRIRSKADITTVTASQFTFTDVNGTSVAYSLSSGKLMRAGQILADDIQSITFSYLDGSGASTSTAANVRYVKLALTLAHDGLTLSMATLTGVRGIT
jgi:prepilin-type N-terminal cleavage/methylation domain-containing protein